jgi:hypothetical protein
VIILDQADTDYHANAAIGSTTAKLWLDSPQLFKDQIDGIRKPPASAALAFGRIAHMAFLQPDLFAARLSSGPINEKTGQTYGAETKTYAAWSEANPQAIVLSDRDRQAIQMMTQRMPEIVREILGHKDGVAESSYYQTLAGVRVKCRPDWIVGGKIYDVKTVGNIDDAERHLTKFKYWFAHAWYRMIVKAETGASMPFRFIFAEKSPPYRWRIIDLDADWIGYADDTVDRVLGEISLAQDSGDYRDRSEIVQMASRPAWESDDNESTESED